MYTPNDVKTTTIRDSIFADNDGSFVFEFGRVLSRIEIFNNTFVNNRGVMIVKRAHKTARISIESNTFASNEGTAVRISNEMQQCKIISNSFVQNSGQYIVEFFEGSSLTAASSTRYSHNWEQNVFSDNVPDHHNTISCAILIGLNHAKFRYNVFNNSEYNYELCLSRFVIFNVQEDAIDATYNYWNTDNETIIANRIIDMNDRNDRPIVIFRPYFIDANASVISMEKYSNRSSLGPEFVGGTIATDVTLCKTDSPYYIESDITVLRNTTLTICAGSELVFSTNVGILVLGRLLAIGNPDARIVFRSVFTTQTSGISGIRLSGGTSPMEGKLEIVFQGQWESICFDAHNTYYSRANLASVACRHLGLEYRSYSFIIHASSVRVRLDSVQCSGDEDTIHECSVNTCVNNCECYLFLYAVCEYTGDPGENTNYRIITPSNFSSSWGGIRIIKNENLTLQSELRYVDITGAGFLHLQPVPALFVRHSSVDVTDVKIQSSYNGGIALDTIIGDVKLEDTTIQQCGGAGGNCPLQYG